MLNTRNDIPIKLKNADDKKMAFEQYKILVESINKLHETREGSNNFWIGVNGLVTSALAYLRDTQNISQYHKCFLLFTLISIGLLLCFSWLSYLTTIKDSLAIRGKILVKLEKNFPIPLFLEVFSLAPDKPSKTILTRREMVVPYLFLAGYLLFAGLLFFFTDEVITSVS